MGPAVTIGHDGDAQPCRALSAARQTQLGIHFCRASAFLAHQTQGLFASCGALGGEPLFDVETAKLRLRATQQLLSRGVGVENRATFVHQQHRRRSLLKQSAKFRLGGTQQFLGAESVADIAQADEHAAAIHRCWPELHFF